MSPTRRPPLVRAAGWVLLASWAPLLLYIPVDCARGGGGNPIGLGLLMVAGTFVAGVLLCADLLCAGLRARRARGSHPPA